MKKKNSRQELIHYDETIAPLLIKQVQNGTTS